VNTAMLVKTAAPLQADSSPDATRALAVVSDASDYHRDPGSSVLTGLLGTAELVREHIGMAATAVLVTADNVEELTAELRRLAPGFGAVYLLHTDQVRARAAQHLLSDTVPVITDRQTTAVALVAALLTTLDRAGIAPAAGRVVIAGTERNPLVATLAAAVGIGEIDSWGLGDAPNFPLRRLTRRGAVVIDLLDSTALRGPVEALDPPPLLVSADGPGAALAALPGLLAAARTSGHPPDVAACLACARALAELTPTDQAHPAPADSARSVTPRPPPHPVR
jgi:hypothetical protein